jgi:hypothetical protein
MKNTIKCVCFVLLYINIFLIVSTIPSSTIISVNAQHHGAPPPLATIGDRNIKMNFVTEPTIIVAGQQSQLKMSLIDANTGGKIQHVTYRITISKDNQTKISDFFHSHTGDLSLSSRNTNTPPTINVEGTFDDLTNAIIPDPSGTIEVAGPLFSDVGIYKADIEITTLDNDKTDLSVPLKYQFDINVKK